MKRASLVLGLIGIVLLNLSAAYPLEGNSQAKETGCAKNETAALVDTRDMRYAKTPLNKLGRGAINIATFYMEVPAAVFRVSEKTDNEILGITLGTAEGIFTSLLRGLTGLYDALTFVIPSYDKPLMQPEYAIDSFDQAYHHDPEN